MSLILQLCLLCGFYSFMHADNLLVSKDLWSFGVDEEMHFILPGLPYLRALLL
jgi:hypothetical protein